MTISSESEKCKEIPESGNERKIISLVVSPSSYDLWGNDLRLVLSAQTELQYTSSRAMSMGPHTAGVM